MSGSRRGISSQPDQSEADAEQRALEKKFRRGLGNTDSAEGAQKEIKQLKSLANKPGMGVLKKQLLNTHKTAQKVYGELQTEAANAAKVLGQAGDSLTAESLPDLPSLIDQARKKTKFQENKDTLDQVVNRVEARKNSILSRLRAPGRSGRIVAGGM